MFDFLDRARALFAAGDVGAYYKDCENVFAAISRLQIGHSKCDLDLVNLESVFGVFEMQKLLGMGADAEARVKSIQRMIAHTIDRSMVIVADADNFLIPASGYE